MLLGQSLLDRYTYISVSGDASPSILRRGKTPQKPLDWAHEVLVSSSP